MKKTVVNRPWQHFLVAVAILYQISAVLHIITLLIQVVINRSLTPIGIVAVFDLQVLFPQLRSSGWESLASLVIYGIIIAASFYWLRSLHVTIEKK